MQQAVEAKAEKKYVFLFREGDGRDKRLLGGKGAGLCEMTRIGLPVPPGFVISTETCLDYFAGGFKLPRCLGEQTRAAMSDVEATMELGFGDPKRPLLVSVRSGAAISMPGMMDTVLNLGINDATVQGLIRRSGNERFAWDSYRRFIQLFGSIVLNIDADEFHLAMEKHKQQRGAKSDAELTADDFKELTGVFKQIVVDRSGKPIPQEEFNARIAGWLPSDSDRAFILSLMHGVYEHGKMAAWIAPPDRGINNNPVDYEYVKLH